MTNKIDAIIVTKELAAGRCGSSALSTALALGLIASVGALGQVNTV
jgi:hypothetical protein